MKLFLQIIFLLAVTVFFIGCAEYPSAAPGGLESVFGGEAGNTVHRVIAPENANKPTIHTASKTVKTTFFENGNTVPTTKEVTETVTVNTGTSYQDKSRELAAKYEALEPVIWLGAALIVAGIILAIVALKMGWPTIAILAGVGGAGSGAAMIALYSFLPSINPYFGMCGLALLLIIPLVYYAYNKGAFDGKTSAPTT